MEPECIIVSEGTLRSDDLFEAFVSYLSATAHAATAERFRADWEEANGDEFEQDFLLNEELFDAMHEAAPTGMYFGALEGDGACFGYWPIESQDDDEMWKM